MAEEPVTKEEKFVFTDEAAEYLGLKLDEVKDLNGFKKAVDDKFVVRANALDDSELNSAFRGRLTGSAVTNIKRNAKNLGVELSNKEIEDLKWEEVNDLVFEKIGQAHKEKITDLESKAGQTNDEALKEWETKYTGLETKFNETKGLLDTTSKDFDTYKLNSEKEKKDFKLNLFMKEGLSKLSLKPEMTQMEKVGFNTIIKESIKLDIGEDGNLIVMDKEGNQIKSEQETGKFKGLDEVLTDIGVKENALKLNKDGGKAAPVTNGAVEQNNKKAEIQGHSINYDARK